MNNPSIGYCVYITGSTSIDFAMLDEVKRAVKQAAFKGWEVFTGNRWGVEAAVVEACHEEHVKCYVFGADKSVFDDKNLDGQFICFDGTQKQLAAMLIGLADRGVVICSPDDEKTIRLAKLFKRYEIHHDMIVTRNAER